MGPRGVRRGSHAQLHRPRRDPRRAAGPGHLVPGRRELGRVRDWPGRRGQERGLRRAGAPPTARGRAGAGPRGGHQSPLAQRGRDAAAMDRGVGEPAGRADRAGRHGHRGSGQRGLPPGPGPCQRPVARGGAGGRAEPVRADPARAARDVAAGALASGGTIDRHGDPGAGLRGSWRAAPACEA